MQLHSFLNQHDSVLFAVAKRLIGGGYDEEAATDARRRIIASFHSHLGTEDRQKKGLKSGTRFCKVTAAKAPWLKVQSPDGREGKLPAKGLVCKWKSSYPPRHVRGVLRAPVCARICALGVEVSVATPLPDPELAAEQDYLEHTLKALAAMRRRAEQLRADLVAAGNPDLDYLAALSRRVALLADSARPLLFGRIDEEEEGPTWHIGRRHVEDARSDPVVIDWRAPVAVPFYRASTKDPQGLARRRQIMVDRGAVVAVADDLFGVGEGDAGSTRLRGGDALLAELERARTGEMLDIVATIQAEQDEIIRAPLDRLLTVQGGPGTGKTAVGLHRAAYLLYNHPALSPRRRPRARPQPCLPPLHRAGAALARRGGRRPDDDR